MSNFILSLALRLLRAHEGNALTQADAEGVAVSKPFFRVGGDAVVARAEPPAGVLDLELHWKEPG